MVSKCILAALRVPEKAWNHEFLSDCPLWVTLFQLSFFWPSHVHSVHVYYFGRVLPMWCCRKWFGYTFPGFGFKAFQTRLNKFLHMHWGYLGEMNSWALISWIFIRYTLYFQKAPQPVSLISFLIRPVFKFPLLYKSSHQNPVLFCVGHYSFVVVFVCSQFLRMACYLKLTPRPNMITLFFPSLTSWRYHPLPFCLKRKQWHSYTRPSAIPCKQFATDMLPICALFSGWGVVTEVLSWIDGKHTNVSMVCRLMEW